MNTNMAVKSPKNKSLPTNGDVFYPTEERKKWAKQIFIFDKSNFCSIC